MKNKRSLLLWLFLICWIGIPVALSSYDQRFEALAVILFFLPIAVIPAIVFIKNMRQKRLEKKTMKYGGRVLPCYSHLYLSGGSRTDLICGTVSRGAISGHSLDNVESEQALEMLELGGYVLNIADGFTTEQLASELESFLHRRGHDIHISAEDIVAHQSPLADERRKAGLSMCQNDLNAAAIIFRDHGLELVELSHKLTPHYLAALPFEDYPRVIGCNVFGTNGGGANE